MVKVILQSNGQVVLLANTPELSSALKTWRESECRDHRNRTWCRFPTSNGGVQIRPQCNSCGYMIGGARKRQIGDEALPVADVDAYDRYVATRQAEYDQILQIHAQKQADRDTSWFRDYNQYLDSDEWRVKRKLVLKRAGNICEGCGTAAATQVHHLTYDHVTEEFLFELVAVCDACHNRLHENADKSDAAEAVSEEWGEHPCDGCRFTQEVGNKPWCFIVDLPVKEALAQDGPCGPKRALFEELR